MKKRFLKFHGAGPIILTLTLANVLKTDGADKLPGIQAELLYNVKDNLTAIPDLPATPTSSAEQVTIEDDFTIAVGKPFKKLECTVEAGRIKSTRVGDRDGGQYKHTCELMVTDGIEAQAAGRLLANSRGYFVVTEMGGTAVLFGTERSPAYIVYEEYDGGQEGQEKGPAYKATITCYGPTPKPPIFTGAAPIA